MLIAALATAALAGCAGYEIVDKSDYDFIQKIKSGQYDLMKKDELAELKREAELGKGVGRYQIYRAGNRTWRLDTATGDTCLLLAPDWEWKKPEIAMQGCQ